MPLLEDGKEIKSDKEKAEIMNKYFCDKVRDLQSKIPQGDQPNPFEKLKEKMKK